MSLAPEKKNNEDTERQSESSDQKTSGLQAYLLEAQKTQNFVSVKKDASAGVLKGRFSIGHMNKLQQKSDFNIKKGRIDLLATVTHYLCNNQFELKVKKPEDTSGLFLLFLIDSSGSMLQHQQIGFIKGVIEQTIAQYSAKKIEFGAIALSQSAAKVLSPFSKDATTLLCALTQLTSGGKTNMKAGFEIINKMLGVHLFPQLKLYIFTDGKINAGDPEQPAEAAILYYKTFLKSIQETVVLGHEEEYITLGLSEKFAQQLGAKFIQL